MAAVMAVDFNRYPDPYAVELCEKCAAFFGVDPSMAVAGNGSDELIGLIVSWFTDRATQWRLCAPIFRCIPSMRSPAGCACWRSTRTRTPSRSTRTRSSPARGRRTHGCSSSPIPATRPRSRRRGRTSSKSSTAARLPRCRGRGVYGFRGGLDSADGGEHDNLIVLKTCSKAFGMAAIRLGFAVANPVLIGAVKAAKSPYNVNSMTQAAGCVLFNHPDYLAGCADEIKASRDTLCRELSALAGEKAEILDMRPTCANFVFLAPDRRQGRL